MTELHYTIGLTIIGWTVVHWLSLRRDIKKEWRDIARKNVELLDNIKKISIAYHTSTERNKEYEKEILNFLSEIEIYFQQININTNFDTDIDKLKKYITEQNFQTNRFQQLELNDPLINNIITEIQNLKTALLQAK